MRSFLLACCILFYGGANAQQQFEKRFSSLPIAKIDSGVTLTFDEPVLLNKSKKTKIIIFALPNGNTTAQTFGKKLAPGDDWHFDIQHIGAQTSFIRNLDNKTNYIVVYIENAMKSWPGWRRKYSGADQTIAKIVDSIVARYAAYHPMLTLSGHSGGGSFIFGYLNSHPEIPSIVERIGFLDATYGYETEAHAQKLNNWLKKSTHSLQIFAYNDSVVIYNGKPLVSPTGGTWYRSKLMAKDLGQSYRLSTTDIADRIYSFDNRHRIEVKLIKNPEAKIFHTVLVEKNGFIDLIFNGTKFKDNNYSFWAERAYQNLVLQ
jgi:pimeloyl-ACP methyl ester carboxylesterase